MQTLIVSVVKNPYPRLCLYRGCCYHHSAWCRSLRIRTLHWLLLVMVHVPMPLLLVLELLLIPL